MTTLVLVLQAIVAALKFPKELRALILLLEKSPEEKRQEIAEKVQTWMKESAESERPVWERT